MPNRVSINASNKKINFQD